MSYNSIFQDIGNGIDFYHKLYELNLSEIFLKEYIILETIKDKIPKKSNDKESLIKNWFEKFDNKSTKELMDFPVDELLNKEDFYNLLIRKSLWIDWCIKEFSNEILFEFNNKKSNFDLITYQLIRTKNKNLSNEIYFKLTEDKESFEDLSFQFSEGRERVTKGIVGPVRANLPHPELLAFLKNSSVGIINPPIEIENWWIICKLKKIEYAKLDYLLKAKISLELGNKYINSLKKDILNNLTN